MASTTRPVTQRAAAEPGLPSGCDWRAKARPPSFAIRSTVSRT
ncbi:hypothetical protein ACFWWM_23110 [Streptomyces sp. NPDC058682]